MRGLDLQFGTDSHKVIEIMGRYPPRGYAELYFIHITTEFNNKSRLVGAECR